MFQQLLIFLVLIEALLACIPTQQIEPPTEAPFPCNVCSKIYNSGCQGFGLPSASNWCSTAAQVPVSYTLGVGPSEASSLPDVCSSQFTCPAGTFIKVTLINGVTVISGNTNGAPQVVYCFETGAYAATWWVHIDDDDHSYDISSIECKNL
ncbi:C6 domain-containing protein [Caenorhabditis elegans]|uniref:C6 domain-containing protein n=1 Tax=Caenorhabditis elegans TaxID=6239 RepID=O17962_CAEEL|nr:C6 domain-containing protein [Caenorhabditis elegans]CAB05566.1 C6 domain-containing protein [Caenorhabditis elegans]|eukprot:NP_506778.1 Uncharacterized protein CELE_M01B2.8 [Caenorhabditis elegans]